MQDTFIKQELIRNRETNPLVKLGEKLMQEHAMLDFHKIVLDTDYRKSLWKRP